MIMTMKPDSSNHPTFPTLCGQCGIDEPYILHHIRHRGNFRRLCTSCVLRLHPQCFCPSCLRVYDPSPPIDAIVCYKCYSSSHSNCVPSSSRPSPCSSCLNPSLLLFNLNNTRNGGCRVIDVTAARLLLAAAKIAAMSMNKAEVAAAMEAERRAKEAAYTKKRAKEALDHVVGLMKREKRNVVESNKKVNNSVVAVPSVVDHSDVVLEALNAVGLKENVDFVNGKDLVAENGLVQNDDVVKIGQEQAAEKIHVAENSVENTETGG